MNHFTFTNLPRCSQSMNSLIYVYSVQIISCFLSVFDYSRRSNFVVLAPLPPPPHHQKKFLYYSLMTYVMKMYCSWCIAILGHTCQIRNFGIHSLKYKILEDKLNSTSSEAATRGILKLFFKNLQYSKENPCVGPSF